MRGVHRSSRRGIEKLQAIQDFNALSTEAKQDHQLSVAMLGVIHHQTKPCTMKRLQGKIGHVSDPAPPAKMLEALREVV